MTQQSRQSIIETIEINGSYSQELRNHHDRRITKKRHVFAYDRRQIHNRRYQFRINIVV